MYLIDDLIIIHISREQTNIPIVYNSFVSYNKKRLVGTHMRSALSRTRLSELYIFGYLHSINNL